MVDRYLSPKFGVNSFSGIRENDVYGRATDGRTPDAGRPRYDSFLLHSRAKNQNVINPPPPPPPPPPSSHLP